MKNYFDISTKLEAAITTSYQVQYPLIILSTSMQENKHVFRSINTINHVYKALFTKAFKCPLPLLLKLLPNFKPILFQIILNTVQYTTSMDINQVNFCSNAFIKQKTSYEYKY